MRQLGMTDPVMLNGHLFVKFMILTLLKVIIMAILVVEFSNQGYKIRKTFALESTYLPKGNHSILSFGLTGASEVFKNQSFNFVSPV